MEDQPLDPKDLGSRIARFSNLRAAERAITPTVRGRARLPSFHLGRELLDSLQRMREAVGFRASAIHGLSADDLAASVDRDLDAFTTALCGVINETPMMQFRATLPGTVEQAREEVEALLDFCLEPGRFVPFPRALVDFAVTLLATERAGGGRKKILHDPSQVTARIAILSREQGAVRDPEIAPTCRALRNAAVKLQSQDELEPTIRQIRGVKDSLGIRILHPEVLRSAVAYNVAIHNRLLLILASAREFDSAADEALATLRALDSCE